jgi:hypothetical protein
VWPFITGTVTDDHALLLDINRLVPKWISEQVRQDVCQDVAVRVLMGDGLSADLVREVLKAGRKAYGLRWDEISLWDWATRAQTRRWADVLSFDNPITRFRPQREPPCPHRLTESVRRGYARGSSSVNSKLTEAEAEAIRHMYHTGRYSQGKLAKEFKVTQATVYGILTGSTWRHAGGPIYMPERDQEFTAMLERAGGSHAVGARAWNKRGRMPQATGFEQFWSIYPRRIAKLAAMKAYASARDVATDAEILAGLKKFNANLPDEARFIPHAASWLNAGRWMDEYDLPLRVEAKPLKVECPHVPPCHSKDWCFAKRQKESA